MRSPAYSPPIPRMISALYGSPEWTRKRPIATRIAEEKSTGRKRAQTTAAAISPPRARSGRGLPRTGLTLVARISWIAVSNRLQKEVEPLDFLFILRTQDAVTRGSDLTRFGGAHHFAPVLPVGNAVDHRV